MQREARDGGRWLLGNEQLLTLDWGADVLSSCEILYLITSFIGGREGGSGGTEDGCLFL